MLCQHGFELSNTEQAALCDTAHALSLKYKDYVSIHLEVSSHNYTGNRQVTDLEWKFYSSSTGHTSGHRLINDAYLAFVALNSDSSKMLMGARELEAKAQLIRKRVAEMEGGKL